MIAKTRDSIIHAELTIPYYKAELEKEDDKEKAGNLGIKIGQLETANNFNKSFLDYLLNN